MIDQGRFAILGVEINAVDYESAVRKIINAAKRRVAFGVSALAVHGIMTGFLDPVQRRRLNGLDLITPDGQPVKWALRWKHHIRLPDRVYGPELTKRVLKTAEKEGLGIYFYGSTPDVLRKLQKNLKIRYPNLIISGMEPSRFRTLSEDEKNEVVRNIRSSQARIVFVGLGCPRQEVWVYEYKKELECPLLAVGAAFTFHAGTLDQAPAWMQKRGLEWLYRLIKEPARLWKRYLYLNPLFLFNLAKEILHLSNYEVLKPTGREPVISYG